MTQDTLSEMIERLSWRLALDYGVEREDVKSEIVLWTLQSAHIVEPLVEREEWANLYYRMKSEGRRWCVKERAHSLGFDPSDFAKYNIKSLRELLPSIFDYEDWQPTRYPDGMPKAKGTSNQSMDRVSMLIDIKTAVSRLPEDQYNVIVWVYKYHWTAEQLAAELEITLDAAQKRIQRAVKRVQSILTDVRPMDVPRRRPVLTNAAARAVQSGHWEGSSEPS